MRLCWRVEFPSSAMSAVAVKLADCANDDGENVYPSVGRIERETRLGAATVRRVLDVFEQVGLLEVVAEASGNKWNRSTTIRRFNIGRLHDLSAVEVRRRGQVLLAPSTHVLKQVRQPDCQVEAARIKNAEKRRAEGKKVRPQKEAVVCDCCPWVIAARGPDDVSDYATETKPPLPEREGCGSSAPPGAGGDPSRSGRSTPPGAGANPSIEPSMENPPSPPMGGESEDSLDFDKPIGENVGTGGASGEQVGSAMGASGADRDDDTGWARGWTDPAREAVTALRTSRPVAHVATHLVDLVRGTLRPQKGADAAAYVRQLAGRMRQFTPNVLARTAQVLLDTRGGYLPDAASVERMARTVAATLRHEADAAANRQARTQASPPADPALAARWAEVRRALEGKLGDGVVKGWFDGATLHRLEGGVLTVLVDVPFKAKWIATHYEVALLEAARQVLGLVSRVVVAPERGAGPQTSGEAA